MTQPAGGANRRRADNSGDERRVALPSNLMTSHTRGLRRPARGRDDERSAAAAASAARSVHCLARPRLHPPSAQRVVAHWHSIVAELTFEARVAKLSAHSNRNVLQIAWVAL